MSTTDFKQHIDQYINSLLRAAQERGFIESEAYYEQDQSVEIQVHEGKVSVYESSKTKGLSFRGYINGQMGYAHTEDFSEETIALLIKKAEQNAHVLELETPETLYNGPREYAKVEAFSSQLDAVPYDQYEQLALRLESKLLQADNRIVAVDHLSVGYGASEIIIYNSFGVRCEHKDNLASVYADVRATSQDGQVKTGYDLWTGRSLSTFDMDHFVSNATQRALGMLGAAPMKSDKYRAVISARAMTDLLASCYGIFSAELIQKGFSMLKDKIGQNIASEKVTLCDFGIYKDAPVSVPFDSEGVPTQNKVLIDKGQLKMILHNCKTAKTDKTVSTGNGFRSGYKSSVSVSSTNLFIQPGFVTQNDLIAHTGEGLLITEVSGLHAGINLISGDFSLLCEGFKISSGKIDRPVDQITIAGNFYKLLTDIKEVGSDLTFNPPSFHGAIGSPSIRVDAIAVSGQ